MTKLSQMYDASAAGYVLGHGKEELERLTQQGEFFRHFTQTVFHNASLRPGMRVLDIGCGAGDVSLIAAGLVGAEGHVVGLDRAPDALQAARNKVTSAGWSNVTFVQGEIHEVEHEKFDAVVGRFILLHMRDPAKTLARLKQALKPGGVMAFIEMDLTTASVYPSMALFDQALAWIVECYRRDGVDVDVGSKLFSLMSAAQLNPLVTASTRVSAGETTDQACDYLAETLRSLMPRIEQLSVADPNQIDVATLAPRLKEQASLHNSCFFYPRMVGAWGALSNMQ